MKKSPTRAKSISNTALRYEVLWRRSSSFPPSSEAPSLAEHLLSDAPSSNDLKMLETDESDAVSIVSRLENSIVANNVEELKLILKCSQTVNLDLINQTTIGACTGNGVVLNALQFSAKLGSLECVQTLLQHGVDVNAMEMRYGHTALSLAIVEGHHPAALSIINYGVAIRWRNPYTLRSYLHYAGASGSPEILKALISCERETNPLKRNELRQIINSIINWQDDFGHTALHLAVIEGSVESCQILLEAGCDPNALDKDNRSALQLAEGFIDRDGQNTVDLLTAVQSVAINEPKEINQPSIAAVKSDNATHDSLFDGMVLSNNDMFDGMHLKMEDVCIPNGGQPPISLTNTTHTTSDIDDDPMWNQMKQEMLMLKQIQPLSPTVVNTNKKSEIQSKPRGFLAHFKKNRKSGDSKKTADNGHETAGATARNGSSKVVVNVAISPTSGGSTVWGRK